MKKHFMIDLETMGIRPDAAIVSIGAVMFDEQRADHSFYRPVDLRNSISHGLSTDQSTVDWWAKQPATIRAAWEVEDAPTLNSALKDLQEWLWSMGGGRENVCVWGNGADFDMVVLRSSYNALGADEPWKYYNVHCFRTMKNMFRVDAPAREMAHRADFDAFHQVQHLQKILATYSISLPS